MSAAGEPADAASTAAASADGARPESSEPLVRLDAVSKVYTPFAAPLRLLLRTPQREPVTALRDASLTLTAGELCAVIGPNGAGKTTLFRVLAGLTSATSGTVRVAGADPEHEGRRVRAAIGWMPADDRSLFLRQTARENLWFHGRLHGLAPAPLRRRIEEVLELVGLGTVATRAAFTLSAGMRARLQLARALLHRPALLVLDEPTGAIDPVAAHDLLERIRATVAEERIGALISSHRLEEIEALHTRVLLLDRGEVRYDGRLEDLQRRWDAMPLRDLLARLYASPS